MLEEKLAEIQEKLKTPKDLRNEFGGFQYRNASMILEAVKPLLGGAQVILSDKVQQVGDRIYVVATATIRHGGETISVEGWAREAAIKKGMDEAQITGSCSSYARKYALAGLFAIDDSRDDPDAHSHRPEPKQQVKAAPKKQSDTEAALHDVLSPIIGASDQAFVAGYVKEQKVQHGGAPYWPIVEAFCEARRQLYAAPDRKAMGDIYRAVRTPLEGSEVALIALDAMARTRVDRF